MVLLDNVCLLQLRPWSHFTRADSGVRRHSDRAHERSRQPTPVLRRRSYRPPDTRRRLPDQELLKWEVEDAGSQDIDICAIRSGESQHTITFAQVMHLANRDDGPIEMILRS